MLAVGPHGGAMLTVDTVREDILRTAAFARRQAFTARQRNELDFAARFEKLACSAERLAATLDPPSPVPDEVGQNAVPGDRSTQR